MRCDCLKVQNSAFQCNILRAGLLKKCQTVITETKKLLLCFLYLLHFQRYLFKKRNLRIPTLEDITSWGEERILARYDEYKLDDIYEANTENQEILTRTYMTGMSTGSIIQSKDVYIVHENKGIILTMRATVRQFDDVLPTFDFMVNSFTYGGELNE